jgi:4-alpha-glucanotransferase
MSRLLAEDLGVVLSETDQILDKYDIPGMKVLQQRIPSNDGENDEIHPHQWSKNVIGYTGTHDSPTIKEWFEEANSTQIESFKEYKSKLNQSFNDDIWDFISLVWESPSLLAVTTVQDLLKLDKTARFNIPGTQENNWSWRLNNLKELESTIENLKSLNESNSRII